MKKIFIISVALLAVVLFFLGIYNFAFKKDIPKETAQQNIVAESKEVIEQKAAEKITVISSQPVMSPFFDKKTETITYYSAKDGTVWQVDADGKGEKQIETTKLDGLIDVLWSPDYQKVITKFKKSGQIYFYEYDRQNKKGIRLKNGIDIVTWDNTGTKIFYKYYDAVARKRSLNMANPDGSNWQKLSDMDLNKISIAAIPSTSNVAYWNYPDAKQESLLMKAGSINGQPQLIFKGRLGGDYLWSPDGTKALVSSIESNNDKMTSLGMLTINGEYYELGIPTIVSKCVWSSDNKEVYYALPGGIPEKSVMPNDYQEGKFTTEDTFWKVEVSSGKKERIVNTEEIKEKYDSSNLFLSPTRSALYFVNKIDGKLYRISL